MACRYIGREEHMDLNNLKIDPEFEEKIPPLTEDEFSLLEQNIVADGEVLDPLIIWNNTILDGHNRYRILKKHPEIPFKTFPKEFPDKYAAIAWICRNQLGRRNLTPEQKRYLVGKQYKAEKASHGAEDGFRGNRFTGSLVSPQNEDLLESKKLLSESLMKMVQARATWSGLKNMQMVLTLLMRFSPESGKNCCQERFIPLSQL